MPVPAPLFQAVLDQVQRVTAPTRLRVTRVRRLALLVTGIIAARSVVLAAVAAELACLGVSAATADSIARRLRRTLHETVLLPEQVYRPAVRAALDWEGLRRTSRRVIVIVDESSKGDTVHLLRVSLAYRGGALPLAWAVWDQQQPLAEGHYWQAMDRVLAQAAMVVPADLHVTVTADRAYDIPPFVDRIAALGWQWVVRVKLRSSLCFRDRHGREAPLRTVVGRMVQRPGQRWKGQGWVFKGAGWRAVSVVAHWAPGEASPLVVLSNQRAQWVRLAEYGRRFWCEPGFRNDKTHGWQWEQSQSRGIVHQRRLLLAMAWASLIVLCLGVQAAEEGLARLAARRSPAWRPGGGRPQHARQSLFTLGLRAARRWLYQATRGPLPWCLPAVDAPSWTAQWYAAQAHRFLFFQTVRP
jgi:hypothetical protein